MFFFFFLAPYARTTCYEEAFFPLGKPKKRRLAPLARLMIILMMSFLLFRVKKKPVSCFVEFPTSLMFYMPFGLSSYTMPV